MISKRIILALCWWPDPTVVHPECGDGVSERLPPCALTSYCHLRRNRWSWTPEEGLLPVPTHASSIYCCRVQGPDSSLTFVICYLLYILVSDQRSVNCLGPGPCSWLALEITLLYGDMIKYTYSYRTKVISKANQSVSVGGEPAWWTKVVVNTFLGHPARYGPWTILSKGLPKAVRIILFQFFLLPCRTYFFLYQLQPTYQPELCPVLFMWKERKKVSPIQPWMEKGYPIWSSEGKGFRIYECE
jgi:hypothetical protein